VRGVTSLCLAAFLLSSVTDIRADDGVNDRPKVWNPVIAGPELLSGVGLQPPGQMFFRVYMFSEVGYAQYGAAWSLSTHALDQKLFAINPNVEYAVGLLPWLECGVFASEASWWQTAGDGNGASSGHGIGDTNPYCKQRIHAPQQGGLAFWLTNMVFVSLPTSEWAGPIGTPSIPGGFAPLGRLPATHFGEPEITELILFRKTFQPFRISGGVYYSYALPGSSGGVGQFFGDIFQYRVAFEHVLDDKRGFAYALEGIGLHGLPFRLDGHTVNAGRSSFGLIGVQPTIEYRFTEQIAGEAGVLFTALGTNDVTAVYPNFSLYYYWNPSGAVAGR
jgi:hypothetical protein